MTHHKKRGFTLIELIMGIVLIGVGLISVITLLRYATRLTNTTKANIIATNLAREGMESMFNKRDTNWNIFASSKDNCWLVNKPKFDDPTGSPCEDAKRITSGGLGSSFTTFVTTTPPQYFTGEIILSGYATGLSIKEKSGVEATTDIPYRMCLQNNTRSYCNNLASPSGFQNRYGRFRRMIEIKGLYEKISSTTGGTNISACDKGSASVSPAVAGMTTCGGPEAKELRFCSRVDYVFDVPRTVELCSVMTNFVE